VVAGTEAGVVLVVVTVGGGVVVAGSVVAEATANVGRCPLGCNAC
jgi:hypothetical protein